MAKILERIDIDRDSVKEVDNRDGGETWIHLQDGRCVAITTDILIRLIDSVMENNEDDAKLYEQVHLRW